jgi:hypothetical protein
MVPEMYHNVPEFMYGPAGRSVLAHIVYLVERGELACAGEPSIDTDYELG